MPVDGLRAWGAKLRTAVRARSVAALALCFLAACGSGDGRKRAVECQTDDDCDPSTLGVCDTVSCVANSCQLDTLPDGHRCNDEDPLTGQDSCLSGICAGVVLSCDDDLGPCLKAVHDPVTDECTVEPVDDGEPCDDDDACTQLDSCQAGACVGGEAKTCAAADDCHVDGECDPKTGDCSDVKAEDGSACDDAQACTTADACVDGACTGEAVVCDDGLACSADSCDEASGACAADKSKCTCVVDADCDDGNACNGQEVCGADDKLCKLGPAVVCPSSADPCLKNVCVAETGACQPEPVKDGSVCDDANTCTARDRCQSGACVGFDAVVCAPLSQCHVAGTCDPVTGACSNPEKADNSNCNDGNACTVTDKCQAGECVGAAPVMCTASDQCHDVGVCDSTTGICSKPAKQNGVQCNDANPCTLGDACQNGVCAPSGQKVCVATDGCHAAGTCDPVNNGNCSNPLKPDGSPCSDAKTCTSGDVCSNGTCAGAAIACNDGIACTIDNCIEQLGGCTSTTTTACKCATSADCDDGNACNGVETCNLQTFQCQPGTQVDCSAAGDACNAGTCSPATGQCVRSPKLDGSPCNDGDLCTTASSCQAGACKGSNPVVCVASDQCHDAGTCNSGTGVCSNPVKANGTGCNDSNACTKTDSCQAGVCTGSNATVCAASDQCHGAGACDASSGLCSNPAKPNNSACDDGSLCTKTDTCQGGVCAGASPITCTASDQCHSAGTCDGTTGTCSNPVKTDGTGCTDNNACTKTDTCKAGVCTAGSAVVCTASDQCHTAGTCDTSSGSCSNPTKTDGTACDDSNACTKTDTCQAGACKSASTVTCSASDPCHTAGTCDTTTGNCSNPTKTDGTLCNDGKTCTTGDKCTTGVCGGGALGCADTLGCSVDSCVEPTGCSHDLSKCSCTMDADCNTDPCVKGRTCDTNAGKCTGGTPVDCSALSDGCNSGKCDATGVCKAVPVSDGITCDDKNLCTLTDVCAAGKCVGKAVGCTASDQCHSVGSCDPMTGNCSNPGKPDGSGCSDGNACTKTDTCKAGVCAPGSAVLCTASDQCHGIGVCDTTSGNCSNPVKAGTCDDGNKCTQTDTCSTLGVCVGSNPVVCSTSDQCHSQGVCDTTSGNCSNPAKVDGTKCNDTDACTANEVCTNGTCGGGGAVVCPPPASTCQTNTCDSVNGCVLANKKDRTLCDDGSQCSLVDRCTNGVCLASVNRDNFPGDWTDDPGAPTIPGVPRPSSTGPTSVDIFTDKAESVHVVGTYVGNIAFNDKEGTPAPQTLALRAGQQIGIYWEKYGLDGTPSVPGNLGGVNADGTLTVSHATVHPDGSFTLLGTILGNGTFGLNGKTVPLDATKGPFVFVVHYLDTGELDWLAHFVPQSQSAFTADSIAAFDDGSVIAIGANVGNIDFFDGGGKQIVTAGIKPGIWAARLGTKGAAQWAGTVVVRGSTAAAQAVTTHEDGSASLTGGFTGTAGLGPNGEIPVSTGVGEKGRDVWFEKLSKDGKILWGGRVGGSGSDIPGDVARVKGGGLLLLANTVGTTPNASDSKTTQQLLHATPAGLQAHVLSIDSDGVMVSDGLIANADVGATRGWQLKLDAQDFYAVAGTFASSTEFWSKVGFGSGVPQTTPIVIKSALAQPGPTTLFLARVDASSSFRWAVPAGGDNSGMISAAAWDVVLAADPSHSATIAGIFNNNATFGDAKPEDLQALLDPNGGLSTLGSPFVVHLNSQQKYDYCP